MLPKPTILDATGITDPVGMLLACVVGILGLFGIPTLLNWDANTVMAFLGFLMGGVAAVRSMYKAAKSPAMVASAEPKELDAKE